MTVVQEYLGINNKLSEVHTLNSEMEPSDLHTGRVSQNKWSSFSLTGLSLITLTELKYLK